MFIQELDINLNASNQYNFSNKNIILYYLYFINNDNYEKLEITYNNFKVNNQISNTICKIYAYDSNDNSKKIGELKLYDNYLQYVSTVNINCILKSIVILNVTNESDPYSLHLDGSNSPTNHINWNNHRITNLANPVNNNDGVNKNYLITKSNSLNLNSYLKIDGTNSPTNHINWNGHTIKNLGDPVDDQDAVNKLYYDNYRNENTFVNGNRAIFAGGNYAKSQSNAVYNNIDYVEIDTLSNSFVFGELNYTSSDPSATSNGINNKMVIMPSPITHDTTTNHKNIDYINITILSDANDYGDLSNKCYHSQSISNGSNNKGVIAYNGTDDNNWSSNRMEYINISVNGNSNTYGQLLKNSRGSAASSNGVNNKGVFECSYKDTDNQFYWHFESINIPVNGNASIFFITNEDATEKEPYGSVSTSNTIYNKVFLIGLAYFYYDTGYSDYLKTIKFYDILSATNANYFADLNVAAIFTSCTSNGRDNRAIVAMGLHDVDHNDSYYTNAIQYFNMSVHQNADIFGQCSRITKCGASSSNCD